MGIIRKLFRAMFLAGHPLLWVVLAVSLYGNHHYRERLYWEVPSVPFQPFCSPKNDWEFSRPIKNPFSLSDEFIRQLTLELAKRGVTMKVTLDPEYADIYGEKFKSRVLIAPRYYKNINTMNLVTLMAYDRTHGIELQYIPEDDAYVTEMVLYCEDIEGVVTQF